jgi:protein-S-isoprenylcysteine O-methyltransferase Ste14
MPELITATAARAGDPILFLIGMGFIYATGLVLLIAAGLKFLEHARHPEPLAKNRRHFFSTREMLIAVLLLFPFWLNTIAQLPLRPDLYRIWFGIGGVKMTAAVVWHVAAKIAIARMWSDGIEIKRQHSLMTRGPYALARHPMYASLLMWCWGASAMMANAATLALTTGVILPLMIRRARDEETELLKADPEYLLYRENAPMLTPKLAGAAGILVRVAAAALLAYCIISGITGAGLILLAGLHVWLGFCLKPEKIGFSYLTKSGMMVAVWAAALVWHPATYVFYFLLAMFAYGLFFNCPCMLVYERYHGCPCIGWIKRQCAIAKSN